jgi:hypothetical protein
MRRIATHPIVEIPRSITIDHKGFAIFLSEYTSNHQNPIHRKGCAVRLTDESEDETATNRNGSRFLGPGGRNYR